MPQVYRLRRNERIRLDGDMDGRVISCRKGILWLTQTGNPGDYLVRTGESFSSDQPGRIVIGALEDSVCFVAGKKTAQGIPSGVILRALRQMLRRGESAGRGLWA